MSHHAAAAVSVSAHELISIPPPPPLISLGHLEKVERGRQRERERVKFPPGAGEVHGVRPPLLWYANKAPGGTEMATAAPRGALKSKQLYPGFLRGVREKCACLPLFKRESIASLFSPLALQLCGKERRHSLSIRLSLSTPLSRRRGCCFMASIKVGQAKRLFLPC